MRGGGACVWLAEENSTQACRLHILWPTLGDALPVHTLSMGEVQRRSSSTSACSLRADGALSFLPELNITASLDPHSVLLLHKHPLNPAVGRPLSVGPENFQELQGAGLAVGPDPAHVSWPTGSSVVSWAARVARVAGAPAGVYSGVAPREVPEAGPLGSQSLLGCKRACP